MKCVLKILGCIGGILVLAKLAQVLVDVLYENYGRRYISTENSGD